jgi:anti-anti-sigma factor
MSIAIDTYIAANVETIGRHQHAIRELSTPVIRVHDRILLMPLVGTVDSLRASQIMETLLVRVVEEKARYVIIDIAGVPVVDTKVADSLVKTTSAVRLLGAETILTGISPPIARTIVQLGVEIVNMHTRARLQEGIELALELAGKVIVDRKPSGMIGSVPILRIGRTLLLSIQLELSDAVAEALQNDVLLAIEKHGTSSLVIDITGFDFVDTYVARILAETSKMARLMGTETVIVGMRPEVAATLVRMGYTMDGRAVRARSRRRPRPARPRHREVIHGRGDFQSRGAHRVRRRRGRRATARARARGQRQLDSFAVAAVTTATSELVRNVYVHAGGGKAILEEVTDGTRYGLRATFIDEGPGIDDLERALRGGYSTTHTMGLGLSGSRRLVDRFEIESEPGKGTCVKIEKWAPF